MIHPVLTAKRYLDDAFVAHEEGRFNASNQSARAARNIMLYQMGAAFTNDVVHDCTALISFNYRTMREMGIN